MPKSRARLTCPPVLSRLAWVLPLVVAGPVAPKAVHAQDVELLGRVHGTRPPDGYYRQLRRDPDSFQFGSEGRERLDRLRTGMRAGRAGVVLNQDAPALVLGPREDPVVGAFGLPMVLGLYSDGPAVAPYSRDDVQREFFDGPNSYQRTLSQFFAEISGGLLQLQGTAFEWQQTGMSRADATLGESGLSSSFSQGVGAFIEAIVQALDDAGVDWSQFDQSGDGFVDVLAVLHPDQGAECDGASNRIWSHRWSLSAATQGRLPLGFRTSTPRADGLDNIYVNDYTVQPLLACDAEDISEIGTFAHELGHGFGLPDLYRTTAGGFFAGAGNWDLMATGGWGCGGSSPERPCHMGAWSKSALGWVVVEEIAPDSEGVITLEPVETSRRVLKLPARDGSREYVLLENRQRLGFDQTVPEPGLLVWHVDQDIVDPRWPPNTVNSDPARLGVWLRQADGRNDLNSPSGGRGDGGDSFPGCIKPSPLDYNDPTVPCETNHEFHAGKPPAAISHQGGGLGVTLTDIQVLGSAPQDVRFEFSTRISTVTLQAEQGGANVDLPGFEVDGVVFSGTPVDFLSAPFQSHEVEAPAGIPTEPGARISFESWTDGAPRARTITSQFSDQTLVAVYSDEEIRLTMSTNDPADGIVPGTFSAEPGSRLPEGDDFWFPRGTAVSVLASPRTGFSFRDWVGVQTPHSNPITFTLDEPGALQANFDLVYSLSPPPGTLEIQATVPQQIELTVTEGNDPVTWSVESGTLPSGLALEAQTGVISGAASRLGEFQVAVLARDGIGLEARATLSFRVSRPELGVPLLVSPFVGASDLMTAAQKEFLDFEGNFDGRYDVGDFRAFVLANPSLPQAATQPAPARSVIPIGAFRSVPEPHAPEQDDG